MTPSSPSAPPPLCPNSEDTGFLKGLEIAHYVVGALTAFFALFPVIHLVMGIIMITHPEWLQNKGQPHHPAPEQLIGWVFAVIGGGFILVGETLAVCIILSGRFIRNRRRYYFSFVTACAACILMPFGTILGVLTLIVLVRPSVKALYQPPAELR